MAEKKGKKPGQKANGKGSKLIKAYSSGVIKKNPHDVAASDVHKKFGTMGNGPKKIPKFKKD